jgi:hypothetical protein
MIEDKRSMYMEQKAREEADIAAVRAEEERKLAIVELERKRLPSKLQFKLRITR